MTERRYGRASATNPGKHGPLDWRVDFNSHAPTAAELVWMVAHFLLAEDRFTRDKRDRLWWFMQAAYLTRGDETEVRELAERVQRAVDDPNSFSLPFRRDRCSECFELPAIRDGLCGKCWLVDWRTRVPA